MIFPRFGASRDLEVVIKYAAQEGEDIRFHYGAEKTVTGQNSYVAHRRLVVNARAGFLQANLDEVRSLQSYAIVLNGMLDSAIEFAEEANQIADEIGFEPQIDIDGLTISQAKEKSIHLHECRKYISRLWKARVRHNLICKYR